jgi:hypothetical protein
MAGQARHQQRTSLPACASSPPKTEAREGSDRVLEISHLLLLSWLNVRVRPRLLVGMQEPLQSNEGSVDGRFARKQEHIVQPSTECAPEERCDHWYLFKVNRDF